MATPPVEDPETRKHQLFLQRILHLGVLKKDVAERLLQKCSGTNDVSFVDFQRSLNRKLELADMQLQTVHCTRTGETQYVLINTNADEVAKLATNFSLPETQYFKEILDGILENDNLQLSSTAALNVSSKIQQLTKKAAQDALDKFKELNWLIEINGYVSLHIRTATELSRYIRDNYEDRIGECFFCKELIYARPKVCSKATCDTAVHPYCEERLASQAGAKCATCNSPWVVEKKGAAASSSKSKRSRSQVLHVSEDEDEAEDEEVKAEIKMEDSESEEEVRPVKKSRNKRK